MKLGGRNLFYIGAFIFILLLGIAVIPKYQAAVFQSKITSDLAALEAKDRVAAIRDIESYENSARTTLAQIVGGVVILFGLYFTYLNSKIAQDNLRVTEEGKLTDRFGKAVELLGNDKLDIRLGGIYALERIARDSQKDHWTVMEVLTAFIRENSHKKLIDQTDGRVREDIQAIMTVIGRRKWVETETRRLNLKKVNLAFYNLSKLNLFMANLTEASINGANLSESCLSKAKLFECDLEAAVLQDADLSWTNLTGAKMIKSDLLNANLKDAFIIGADLTGADLSYAQLNDAHLNITDLQDANFNNTDIEKARLFSARNLTLKQVLTAKNYENALLPADVEKDYKAWQLQQAIDGMGIR